MVRNKDNEKGNTLIKTISDWADNNSGFLKIIEIFIIVIGLSYSGSQLYYSAYELNLQTANIRLQVEQNKPHLSFTAMCPILTPDKVSNYSMMLHNFGNSPTYYTIDMYSENMLIRMDNHHECWFFNDNCFLSFDEFSPILPSNSNYKLNFYFKLNKPENGSFLIKLSEFDRMGNQIDFFTVLNCTYLLDKENNLYLDEYARKAKENGLLEDYIEQTHKELTNNYLYPNM
ncbi:MAG: hypothetical protein JW716_00400 [Candidatus Aenigmarchaeota archaeon]|nr:hypothetical protein [Candidatus Aenigmarchaeota archaeon]